MRFQSASPTWRWPLLQTITPPDRWAVPDQIASKTPIEHQAESWADVAHRKGVHLAIIVEVRSGALLARPDPLVSISILFLGFMPSRGSSRRPIDNSLRPPTLFAISMTPRPNQKTGIKDCHPNAPNSLKKYEIASPQFSLCLLLRLPNRRRWYGHARLGT